ncbi:MDR family MFS transporter [Geobacillus icigianus]|nr:MULTISPECIES: MFS transporter [Geobacillus]KYD25624.1 hypothetical protein B4113_1628 [Geobacillus sp. B4113_201601]
MEHNKPLSFSVRLLLISAFLMNTGSFMIVPFLAVYLSKDLHFNAWQVGTVLTVSLVMSRVFPFIAGVIGDRTSHMLTLILGIVLRGCGYLGFAMFSGFGLLTISSAFIGLGGALYDPSVLSIFSSQPEELRKRTFTYLNQFLNAGAILGPLIGGVLILWNPSFPFCLAGSLFIIIALMIFSLRSRYPSSTKSKNILQNIQEVLKHKQFILFTLVMVLFWMMFSQLTVSIPIYAFDISKSEQWVSYIFTVNGVTGILAMFALRKKFMMQAPLSMIRKGLLLMSIAFCLLPAVPSIVWLMVCILIFTIGETFILPASDMAIADYSNGKSPGSYFGFFDFSWALGGAIGNYLGVWLSHFELRWGGWLIFGVTGLISAILIKLLEIQHIKTQNDHRLTY